MVNVVLPTSSTVQLNLRTKSLIFETTRVRLNLRTKSLIFQTTTVRVNQILHVAWLNLNFFNGLQRRWGQGSRGSPPRTSTCHLYRRWKCKKFKNCYWKTLLVHPSNSSSWPQASVHDWKSHILILWLLLCLKCPDYYICLCYYYYCCCHCCSSFLPLSLSWSFIIIHCICAILFISKYVCIDKSMHACIMCCSVLCVVKFIKIISFDKHSRSLDLTLMGITPDMSKVL